MRSESRRIASRLGLALFAAFIGSSEVRAQIDPDDLRVGLIATFRDAALPKPHQVVQLEPIPAINLKAGESPHPRISAEGGTYRWEGYLNVLRAGDYQFSAALRGK